MSGIIIILEIILVMFLWSEQFISVLLWIISIIMFQMSFGYGNEHLYYCDIIKVCGFGIYSLVLSISIFINEYIASLMGVIYIGFVSVLTLISTWMMGKKFSSTL